MNNTSAFGLREVLPSEANPFDTYAQLSTIWSPALARIARYAIDESFEEHRKSGDDYGAVVLITNPNDTNDVWGITGFTPWPDSLDGVMQRVGLRWHGLVPERRGHGLSLACINTMRALAHARYPNACHFVEFMPVIAAYAGTAAYFERAGFRKYGVPEKVDWSSVMWQEFVCDIGAPLALSRTTGPMPAHGAP